MLKTIYYEQTKFVLWGIHGNKFFEFNIMRFYSTYSTLRNTCIGFQEFSVYNFNKVESYCEWGFQKAWEWDLKLLIKLCMYVGV